MMRTRKGAVAVLLVGVLTAGCTVDSNDTEAAPDTGALPQGSETVELDPAAFTTEIDNPWWPMTPGSTWVYKETDQE
jgi:hypothetical protein